MCASCITMRHSDTPTTWRICRVCSYSCLYNMLVGHAIDITSMYILAGEYMDCRQWKGTYISGDERIGIVTIRYLLFYPCRWKLK